MSKRKAQLLNNDSKNWKVFYDRGVNYKKKKQYERALKTLNEAVELNPQNDDIWFQIGYVNFELNRFKDALFAYKKSLKINSNAYGTWNNLGVVMKRIKQYDNAIFFFKKSLELNSKNIKCWNNLGETFIYVNQYNKAINALEKALEIDPEYISAWYHIGLAYKYIKEFNKAVNAFRQIIESNPKKKESWCQLGICYLEVKEFDKSIESINCALEIDPVYRKAWFYLGLNYQTAKKYEMAIKCYKKAIEINSAKIDAWINLGNVFNDMKRHDLAIKCCEKALAMNNDKSIIWNNLGYYLILIKEYNEAYKALKHALKLDPNYIYAIGNLGFLYYKKEEYEKALIYLKKAIKIDGKLKEHWYYLGKTHKKKGNLNEAKECLERAIEIDINYHKAWAMIDSLTTTESKKLAQIEGFDILRGGDWRIEGQQSIFYFKVKIVNNFPHVITNIQVILTSIPTGLKAESDRYIIERLNPNSYESPVFKLKAKNSCVGDIIKGIVIFQDSSGIEHTAIIQPLVIKYVCNLLVKKEVSREEFETNIMNMQSEEIKFDCSGDLIETENSIKDILDQNNFYILDDARNSLETNSIRLEGYAQGKYDKEEIALSVIMHKLDERLDQHTKLIIKAMCNEEGKLIDILRDINGKCIEIKTDTELIKDYSSQIEEIFEKVDDLEDYLIKKLGSDFAKISHAWKQYKAGRINKKQLIWACIKLLGKQFIKKIF